MKDKKVSVYLVIVIIIFVLILYFTLKDDYYDIIKILSSIDVFYLMGGILFVFFSKYLIAETTYLLAKKEKDSVSKKKMLEICLIYPFFAGITPSSVGGESFEIFYLKRAGLPYGKASNIVIQKFILYQMSLIIVNILAVILNIFTNIVPNNSFVNLSVIISFVANIIGLVFFYLLAYNKKFNHFIMKKGLLFLHKIKIIKNIDATRKKVDSYLNNFDDSVDKLRKDRKLFIKLLGINVLSFLFFYLSIWPLALSIKINSIDIINLFILVTYVRMMSLLIVTPGQ